MKDIDFDELDRAVGSVLSGNSMPGTAPQPAPTARTASAPTSVLSAQPTDSSASEAETPRPEPPKIGPVAPARKRGQFLDMVHPSADMRHKTTLPTGIRKTLAPISTPTVAAPAESKPAADVQPDAADVLSIDPIAVQTQDVDTDERTPVVPEPAQPSGRDIISDDTEAIQAHDPSAWPDLHEDDESGMDSGQSFTNEPVEAQSLATATCGNEPLEPVQTPFVTDAKVDKRPLGAFADTDSSHADEADELTLSEDSVHVQPIEGMPELATDVNSIEAAGISEAVETTAIDTAPATPVIASIPSAQPAGVGFGQSISQQYKTAAREPDADMHPLFDTEDYHQPLLPDGKKKSHKGIFVTILLLILLVVGGGLGYLAYTMGL